MSVPNQNLFAEFAPTTKTDWVAKIEKDLKGRPITGLDWQIASLSIAPFLHGDDFEEKPFPILDNRSANTWAVGEDVEVTDSKAANQQILAALMAGVNAPRFVFDHYPTEKELLVLLKNVELDFIATHFKEKTEKNAPLRFLKNFADLAGTKAKQLSGAVHYDPFADGQYDVQTVRELIIWAAENLPSFAVITVNAEHFYQNTEGVVSELSNALVAGEKYLKKLINKDLSVETIQKRMAFSFRIGSSYFVEIAKLRAFKLLWANVLSAYGSVVAPPRLFVQTSALTTADDVHTHKIKATTQAMSAVIGGVETLTVAPSEATDFGRRIARNVQHLLSLESYLDRVKDPSAGSYYIEKMTEQLAEAAWEAFQK